MSEIAVPTSEGFEEDYAAKPQHDYFAFGSVEKIILPDGVSYVEFDTMNEGAKSRFQKDVQRDLIIERGSGNARTKVDPSVERHALLMASIKGWNLKRGNRPIHFDTRALRDFLEFADPKVIELIELAIRKANPWLVSELSVADIDEQIDQLKELREEAVKREAGEASSSSR